LDRFLMTTLAPANLVPKTIAGKVVKSKEMVDYFSKYLEIFNGDEIPEPKSIFESTAEVSNLHALADAHAHYIQEMEYLKQNADNLPIVDVELIKIHRQLTKQAIELFDQNSRFGGETYANHFHSRLVQEINDKFQFYQSLNDSKIKGLYHWAKDSYIKNMEIYCKKEEPLDHQDLADHHVKLAKEAFRKFHVINSSASVPYSQELKEQLVKEINERYIQYQSHNDSKIKVAIFNAQINSFNEYKDLMEQVLEGPLSINVTELKYKHRDSKKLAVDSFLKLGSFGSDLAKVNLRILEEEIEDKYAYYKELNSSKLLSKRLKATVEQLSDNETYQKFWRSKQQQKIAGVAVASVIVARMIFGG